MVKIEVMFEVKLSLCVCATHVQFEREIYKPTSLCVCVCVCVCEYTFHNLKIEFTNND